MTYFRGEQARRTSKWEAKSEGRIIHLNLGSG